MRPNLPTTIFFDMDDTIVDLAGTLVPCWRATCDNFIRHFDGLTAEELYTGIDTYREWFWSDPERHRTGRLDMKSTRREIVAEALRRMGRHEPVIAFELADAFTEARKEMLCLFPEAVRVLTALRASGIKLGLITNGGPEEQRHKIEKFALAVHFDAILIEGEFGVGKPDERVFRHMLAALDVAPADAWMVGDNLEWDIAGAQRVGIHAIWRDITGNGVPDQSPVKPDRIIRTLTELV
jgi:putative hydrolase of the HAD superfamily